MARLAAAVWGDKAPETAWHQVRKAVSELRRLIPDGDTVIVTDGSGYRAVVDDSQLDLAEFDALLRQADSDARAGRRHEAREALRSALGLWRGPILLGEGGQLIESVEVALTERKLAVFEQFAAWGLESGEAAILIPELRQYAEQHPLRETLRAQLITALHDAGRQAEALDECAKVRTLLADELGADPGPELARVYETVLRQGDGPPSPAAAPPPGSARPRAEDGAARATVMIEAPRTLPHDIPDFTGRRREIREILDHVRRSDPGKTTVVAIDGMGGSGKTALAIHVAHTLSADYPDGQLYIDLRGCTPGERELSTGAALQDLLRMLGFPGDRIPDDLPGRVAVWRSALVDKRVLLLADNAADPATICDLIPSSPGCLMLATSRARLVELDGASWVSIGPMLPEDSMRLARTAFGDQRVRAEPAAADELITLCGNLPLALRIAAARLRNRPAWTLEYLVERLRDESRRLDELSTGGRGVAETISLSYECLDPDARAAFPLLAAHPGEVLDACSTAALLSVGETAAEDILERLLDSHLLQQPEIGRYAFHDLVRGYARGLRGHLAAEAVERLLDYYLAASDAACGILYDYQAIRSQELPGRRPAAMPPMRDDSQARRWLSREAKTIRSAALLAQRHGYDRHAVCIARNIGFYFNRNGQITEFWKICQIAVDSGRRIDSPELLALSLTNLSLACWTLGKNTQAIEAAGEALGIVSGTGDQRIEALAEGVMGRCRAVRGEFAEGLAHLKRAVDLQRNLGAVQVSALTGISSLYEEWGKHADAAGIAEQASALARHLGQPRNEWMALADLAAAHAGLGKHAEAERFLNRARELCEENTEEPGLVAVMLALSADTAHRLGRESEAEEYADRALLLSALTSSPVRRVKALNTIGHLLVRRGEYSSALDTCSQARDLAELIGYRPGAARARSGMRAAASALGGDRARASSGAAAGTLTVGAEAAG